MMEILTSLGGARTTQQPKIAERPIIKVAPKGIAGERGGQPIRGVAAKKGRMNSALSLPHLPQQAPKRGTGFQQKKDINPRAATDKLRTGGAKGSLTSRSDLGAKRDREMFETGSLTMRSKSPDNRQLDRQLLDTLMSKSDKDVHRLSKVSENTEHVAVPPIKKEIAWTSKQEELNDSQTDLSQLDSARTLAESMRSTKSRKPLKHVQSMLELPNHNEEAYDGMPSIANMTDPKNVIVLADEERKDERMKYIDLFHQLIIWKKTTFLLDNLSFTQDMCDALVEEGLFNVDMMGDIMAQKYDVERTLKMLSLLGTYGHDCYDGFLRVLVKCRQNGVVREIRKAERYTKFGEQLPAVFHYFLNMSDFLKKYSHIATKLGEDEKVILQKYIDGHIEVGIRKNEEKVIKMAEKIGLLKAQIRELKNEIRVRTLRELELEDALARANRKIDELYKRLSEQQDISLECRNEARKLRHFRAQQEELVKFIVTKSEELEMPELGPRQLSRQLSEMKHSLDRQKDQLEQTMLERQATKDQMGKKKTSAAGKRKTPGVGTRQHSKLGSRQNTRLSRANTMMKKKNPDSILSELRINQTQLNIMANKVYYMLVAVQTFEKEERRITQILESGASTQDKAYRNEMRKMLTEIRQERKALKEQLTEQEKHLYIKEGFVKNVRKDILGVGTTPADVTFYKTQHDSLVSQMQKVMDHMKVLHTKDLDKAEEKRQDTVKEFEDKIQDIKNKNIEEQGKLRLKIRTKITEINDREKILNRLKKQITTMANYASKNMNAQATVDECRKITRSMIGEARKLKAIAEEKDREKAELEKLEAIGDEDKIRKFQEAILAKEAKRQKLIDKRKRRKKQDYLADDRLRYIGDRLCLEWRVLGKCLGFTNNRMDMVEWDCPLNAKQDQICFAMLKAWRDEERGKILQLVEALRQMGRNDLAIIVLPLNRMHLLEKKKKKKKKKGEESDDDEDDDDDDDDDEADGELPALPPPGAENGGGAAAPAATNAAVPKLPAI